MKFLVDEQSLKLQTIVTHWGLFRYRKVPEGLSLLPMDVKKMDEYLRGIKDTFANLGNIFDIGKKKIKCA